MLLLCQYLCVKSDQINWTNFNIQKTTCIVSNDQTGLLLIIGLFLITMVSLLLLTRRLFHCCYYTVNKPVKLVLNWYFIFVFLVLAVKIYKNKIQKFFITHTKPVYNFIFYNIIQ